MVRSEGVNSEVVTVETIVIFDVEVLTAVVVSVEVTVTFEAAVTVREEEEPVTVELAEYAG